MKISVIVPTHNRATTLRNTLAALDAQTLPRDEFEVIVVDDGSDEDNRERIRRYRADYNFTLVEKHQGGLASARNLGSEHAKGELLHFLDDDVVPEADTLEQHLASHAAELDRVAVVGSLPFPKSVKLDNFLWYLERAGHYDLYKHPRKYPGGKPPLPPMNGNSSIQRDLFCEIGRYDESFKQYGSEDLELGHRLAQAGVRFVYNPRAVGYHDHIKDFPQFCVDMETAGESLIQVYERYPEIKASKKIDLLEDRFSQLPSGKKVVKLIMASTLRFPWLLGLPRWIIRRTATLHSLRHLLFPVYRWVAHYHYAVGMRRGLARMHG